MRILFYPSLLLACCALLLTACDERQACKDKQTQLEGICTQLVAVDTSNHSAVADLVAQRDQLLDKMRKDHCDIRYPNCQQP